MSIRDVLQSGTDPEGIAKAVEALEALSELDLLNVAMAISNGQIKSRKMESLLEWPYPIQSKEISNGLHPSRKG